MKTDYYSIHNLVFGTLYNSRRDSAVSLPRILKIYGKTEDYQVEMVMSELERLKLIDVVDSEFYNIKISDKGIEVYNEFGMVDRYVEHLSRQRVKKQKVDNLNSENLQLDVTLKKWQKKTFWFVFMFGIWGGITGSVALYLELQERYWSPQKEIQTVTTTDTNKVLPQTKKDGSKYK